MSEPTRYEADAQEWLAERDLASSDSPYPQYRFPAWELAALISRLVREAVAEERNALREIVSFHTMNLCPCGGKGPDEGCDICNVYHRVNASLDAR